ncbi:MAG TPA: hypothetical protein PKC36_12660 [Dietzia sp.]|nr:hypothetical protein [Dietzia sp.]
MTRIGVNRRPVAILLALVVVGLLAWGYWWKATEWRRSGQGAAKFKLSACLIQPGADTDRCIALWQRNDQAARERPVELLPWRWTW